MVFAASRIFSWTFIARDNDAEKHPIIIDIHGGGLIAGRKEQNQNLATWLAKEGYLTFVPDYRLVPETNIFAKSLMSSMRLLL